MNSRIKNIFNLEHLCQSTIFSPIKETNLIRNIKLISKNFTTHRSEISKYVLDRSMVSAYSCFYLPTNALKFQFILQQLDPAIGKILSQCHFIDIGCGPGTYFLAMLDQIINQWGKDFTGEILAIDNSALMLEQAQKNCHHFFGKEISIEYQNSLSDQLSDKLRPRVVLLGNVVNEIGIIEALSLIKKANADYVFIIDIGTPDLFEKILSIRAQLANNNYSSLYPCFDIKQKCPLENDDMESNGWCHQILRTINHPSIERLSQLVSINRKSMPFISHVYSRTTNEKKISVENQATFVRYISESKFAYVWESCVWDKQKNHLVRFEILKKYLLKDDQKKMKKMSVGIRFLYTVDKVKQNGEQQIRLVEIA